MNASFDIAAQNYDVTFTHSVIGKLQRDLVYGHLSNILKKESKTILEINCGTGEDAIWMAKQDFSVIATDISSEMISVAKNKSNLKNLSFQQADINNLSEVFPNSKFELIFSNFGGLNCLTKTELAAFFKSATELLTENGRLILVVMPKNTLWEQLYFLLKGNLKNAFRRKKEAVIANVDGENVKTYYYNPKELVTLSCDLFRLNQVKPIGFFIPPSYLEPFFKNKPNWVSVLNRLENLIKNQSFLAQYSDHYLIELQKK
ncbi:class I SAM-dependent methyltransferase [Flavobacterium sp. SM15]|uniref:class I SAM-dependent methyltransferase n=1 Tax=Flavobacterium sp. SM15 TaxID=2908005 RepID=UPI001EDAB593|nr:class I SAM-dependent methyltransferase [Flavobacterium sp. SM15]MCG2610856.1 class I SAM-dependent methyltransferase [Flavobacterium sp. SM15]